MQCVCVGFPRVRLFAATIQRQVRVIGESALPIGMNVNGVTATWPWGPAPLSVSWDRPWMDLSWGGDCVSARMLSLS